MKNTSFLSEEAISHSDDDIFNFNEYAGRVKTLIQSNSDNSSPLVIGIYGKWGEGKTSFLNLIKKDIDIFKKDKNQKGILKYNFNPWRYGNEEEILLDFYRGLYSLLNLEENDNVKKAGKLILKYSRYLQSLRISSTVGVPEVFGGTISYEPEKALKALGEDLKGEELSLESIVEKINEYLQKSKYKIIVFIDDLDRLDKDEIYSVLKLIKLNGNFENFVYIIALDEIQVSKAISNRYGNDIEDGILFLDKIINIPIRLPRIEKKDLIRFFKIKIKAVYKNLDLLKEEKAMLLLNDIYEEIGLSTFKNPREIIKTLNGFFISAFAMKGEINLRDLFWLELLKVRDPKLYDFLKKYIFGLINLIPGKYIDFNDEIGSKDRLNGNRKRIKEQHSLTYRMFEGLFPSNNEKNIIEGFNLERTHNDLNIREKSHYEKYFSLNMIGKVSVKPFNLIINELKSDDSNSLDIIVGKLKEIAGKASYHIELDDFIKTIEENKFKLFDIILGNLEILPSSGIDIFGKNYKENTIEIIAKRLNSEFDDNALLSLDLSTKLKLPELCFFARKFEMNRDYRIHLDKVIAEKINTSYLNNNFEFDFFQPKRIYNKMLIQLWSKYYNSSFLSFIDKELLTINKIASFLQNFATLWDNKFFGKFEIENYNYLKTIVDPQLIYNKIEGLDINLVESVDINNFIVEDKDMYSTDDNLKQFIFWYLKDIENN